MAADLAVLLGNYMFRPYVSIDEIQRILSLYQILCRFAFPHTLERKVFSHDTTIVQKARSTYISPVPHSKDVQCHVNQPSKSDTPNSSQPIGISIERTASASFQWRSSTSNFREQEQCVRLLILIFLGGMVNDFAFPKAMQVALNILGLNCYHSIEFFRNIADCKAWNAAQDAKFFGQGNKFTRSQWDALLGSFSAVSADPPAVAFADDLIAIYPEAKVILVERNIDDWYTSFNSAVIESSWSPFLNFLGDWDPWLIGPVRDCHFRWIRGWWKVQSKDEMQALAKRMYTSHYDFVRNNTLKARLLEYKLGDGWEPLCCFLDKEIPDVDFPKVNDGEHMKELLTLIARRSMWNILQRLGKWATPVLIVTLVCSLVRK